MNDARSERAALCDLLLVTGPNAPTLCEGWTTRDLVTHLVLRDSDPVATAGMFLPPFAGLLKRRSYELSVRTAYPDLVERLRRGPRGLSPFRIPAVDAAANLTEFFIHLEDVRRGGGDPLPPRVLPAAFEDLLWRQLRLMSRMMFRKATAGVVLERETGETLRARPGSPIVHLVGRPGELVLYISGRTTAAQVEVIGEQVAVADITGGLGL
ncbi:TIGR03085 family metal-binding protein [Propionicicella superfundia]|uniref:TIGR03085 family metal-binding protein n=1 Tax=Propionicicella superfundia TaxID=348582 RepID=UPI00048EB41B|nr:TIGR03085 family metal-binding protein [Propionicicella superfundia]